MSTPPTPATLLGGLSIEEFLEAHWQKAPLHVPGAVAQLPDLEPEELAALACCEDVESRLVLEHAGAHPWEVRHGPFRQDEFTGLPGEDWTLLVQEVDRHLPLVADLLDRFRFIPNWRIDDVMVSYAAPGGGVGAHVDQYDVFLLQGAGRRRWRIAGEPVTEETLVPGLELRILDGFEPDAEWVLEPGDMLYLPPRIAHEGTALDACVTYSVGFRAPSHQELVSGILTHAAASIDPDLRYGDPGLRLPEHPGEISADAVSQVETMLRGLVAEPARLQDWFARYVTEPGRDPVSPDPPFPPAELAALIRDGGVLYRLALPHFAFIPVPPAGARLYAGGHPYELDESLAFAAPLLCGDEVLDSETLGPYLDRGDLIELLAELCNRGLLVATQR